MTLQNMRAVFISALCFVVLTPSYCYADAKAARTVRVKRRLAFHA